MEKTTHGRIWAQKRYFPVFVGTINAYVGGNDKTLVYTQNLSQKGENEKMVKKNGVFSTFCVKILTVFEIRPLVSKTLIRKMRPDASKMD